MGITLKIVSIVLINILLAANLHAEEEEDDRPVEISYVKMKPSFVSNLVGGPEYIRCDIQLMTKYAEDVPEIQLHMPALRHSVLMVLAGADGNELATPEGKEAFRLEALAAVNSKMKELTEQPRVKDLYFTAYYVK